MASVFNQVPGKKLTEQSQPGTAAAAQVHTRVRVAIDVLDYEYTTMSERSRRASPQPDYSQLSVDAGSDLEIEEGSAPSTHLSWLRIMREYTQSISSRARMLG